MQVLATKCSLDESMLVNDDNNASQSQIVYDGQSVSTDFRGNYVMYDCQTINPSSQRISDMFDSFRTHGFLLICSSQK